MGSAMYVVHGPVSELKMKLTATSVRLELQHIMYSETT